MLANRGLLSTAATAAMLVAVLAVTRSVAEGGDQKRSVEAIENDLVADDPAVRAKAAAELTDRFPDGAVAVPMLIDLLEDESPQVVAAAAKAIDSMAIGGAETLVPICATDELLRWQELHPLIDFRAPGVSDVFPVAEDPVPRGAIGAAALLNFGLVDEFRTTNGLFCLVYVCKHSTGQVRTLSAAALAMIGADFVAMRGLSPSNSPRRSSAARAAVPLMESKVDLRSWAGTRIVARLRPSDPIVVDALVKLLAGPGDRVYVRRGASQAIAAIGPAAKGAIPLLVDAIRNHDPAQEHKNPVEEHYVVALAKTGGETHFRKLLADRAHPDSFAQILAQKGLAADAVIPYLMSIHARYKGAAVGSLEGLAAYGPRAVEALPSLREALKSPEDEEHGFLVAEAVLAIAPGDQVATNALDKFLDARGVTSLSFTHGRRTPTDREAQRLVEQVRSGQGSLNAIDALRRCGPAARGALDELVRRALEPDKGTKDVLSRLMYVDFRQAIARAFGAIGADARDAAVPILEKWRTTGDETIRVPAAQALRRIRAKK